MSVIIGETAITVLWNEYKKSPTIQLRNEIVLKYAGIVKSIVKRVALVSGNYAEPDDLNSYGMIGLIKAVEKFDPEKGVAFETFATYRIRGEIIDYMRRNDWVPRGVRKKAGVFEKTVSELTNRLCRQPSDDELATALNIDRSQLARTLSEIERFNVVSLEELIQETVRVDDDYDSKDTPEGRLAETELLDVLETSVENLPEREKLVIALYYHEELTLKEISTVIGVSESRVSQIHSHAIAKLKKDINSYINC